MVATVSVPPVPLSASERRGLGVPAESLIVQVPAASAAPRVILGVVLERINGLAFEKVFVALKVLAWLRYATFVSVPAVLISAPLS